MRFTRLRLNGFKSFVDPTDLVIADGLTGVVGPNGCGKSNLLEAMRWVMGETRPKAMRGGGMEDVIFAGAATRGARAFAEVSLHIDNTDRLAPAGFNDSDTLDITRRITRDLGSAYKANGKETRARDVQMLFADASTGAHSPALVRQGQIAELINAKPRARRRVLEEAAGISGLYHRRHEAELKLKSTEANLLRVDDVLDQLATRLGQLARQVRQAARYRAIGEDLRRAEASLHYVNWAEADQTRAMTETALRTARTAAVRAEHAARIAAETRIAHEAALPPLREEETIAATVLHRARADHAALTAQDSRARDQIAGLTRRIEQLARDAERETTLHHDAHDMIQRLTQEAQALEQANAGHTDRLSAAAQDAAKAATALQDREIALSEITEAVAQLAARHHAATRLVADTQKARDRALSETKRTQAAAETARAALAKAAAAQDTARVAQDAAQSAADAAEAQLLTTETARSAAQDAEGTARAARSEAEGETTALRAEVSALARVLDRGASDETALLDALTVTPGYEKALGAALGDDLRAAEVVDNGSGWRHLPGDPQPAALPAGAIALPTYVQAPPVLARRLSQVGVVQPAEASALHTALTCGQRLVSTSGDLWRWDGFQINGNDAPSTAALRLEQVNRLEALRADLAEAETRLTKARTTHDAARTRLADLTAADQAARTARQEADAAMARTRRALSQAEADQTLAHSQLEALSLAAARHKDDAAQATADMAQARTTLAGLGDLETERARIEDMRTATEAARILMVTRRTAHDDIRRIGEARRSRAGQIARDLEGWHARLSSASGRAEDLTTRHAQAQEALVQARRVPDDLASRRRDLADAAETAQTRHHAATEARAQTEDALHKAITAERDAERHASDAREARAASQARAEAAAEVAAQTQQRMWDDTGKTPADLHHDLGEDAAHLPSAHDLEAEVQRLRRKRDALGAVNLRAEDDAAAVQAEHDTLGREKQDLDDAVKTLRAGISGLNREGRERLLAAFDQVNANFGMLFTHLFGGGEANLVMVESEDPLDAGLEIMCQPPGKKLSTLSLLSGGEQTLTALALIFAVFLANPAPICVLDEVDAPLDDANINRFCDMLDDMRSRTDTRFLVITHHAITMARMDRLFGVTMQEQGVSQLVSVDLKRAERMVA